MKLELTQQEAQTLINLIDAACRAGGLQAAEACLVMTQKIMAASTAVLDGPAPPASGD